MTTRRCEQCPLRKQYFWTLQRHLTQSLETLKGKQRPIGLQSAACSSVTDWLKAVSRQLWSIIHRLEAVHPKGRSQNCFYSMIIDQDGISSLVSIFAEDAKLCHLL